MKYTEEQNDLIIESLMNTIMLEKQKIEAYKDYADTIKEQLDIALKQVKALKEAETSGVDNID